MKLLEFLEPHPSGGTCRVRMTEQQAIDYTKKIHPELTDERALEDFTIIHWAYWVEEQGCSGSSMTKEDE